MAEERGGKVSGCCGSLEQQSEGPWERRERRQSEAPLPASLRDGRRNKPKDKEARSDGRLKPECFTDRFASQNRNRVGKALLPVFVLPAS